MNINTKAIYTDFPLWNTFHQHFDKFVENPYEHKAGRSVEPNLKEVIDKFKKENEEKISKLKQDFVTEFRIVENNMGTYNEIHILLPNVYKDEVTIESYKNQLTVTFNKYEEEIAPFVPNSFTKTFTFGEEFDMDKISTNLDYGVLNIIVPKRDKSDQKFETKTIKVN